MGFGIFQQAVELGSLPVSPCIVIIAVNVVNFPVLLRGILRKHSLLIPDTVAVVI